MTAINIIETAFQSHLLGKQFLLIIWLQRQFLCCIRPTYFPRKWLPFIIHWVNLHTLSGSLVDRWTDLSNHYKNFVLVEFEWWTKMQLKNNFRFLIILSLILTNCCKEMEMLLGFLKTFSQPSGVVDFSCNKHGTWNNKKKRNKKEL